jgi:hypothetical protein
MTGYSIISKMKILLAIILSLMAQLPAFSQLHDNTWILGYPGNGSIYGHSILTFTEGSLQIDSNSLMNDIDFPQNNSAFSNEQGDLFVFFNGLDIRNKLFVNMENGDDMHEEIDFFTGYYLSSNFITHGSVFLPYPGHKDSIILLYESTSLLLNDNGWVNDIVSYDVTAAIISTTANGGLGKVIARKNPVLTGDTLMEDGLKAVKHANGRDWWVLKPQWNSKEYYRIIIDPAGAHNLGIASVDLPILNGGGCSTFSPDGSKYVIYNAIDVNRGSYLDIFDFDRCTGYLSKQIQIHGTGVSGGVCISPNSRYLYHNKSDTAFQYDLHATDIPASRKVVAVNDGFTDPFPVRFYMMQLAPDGRIYSSATSGARYLHVIHRPDEAGTACGYEQRGIRLYKYNDFSVPNFPNYRLGPLDGSPCDTLGLDNLPKAWFRYEQDTLDPLRVAFRDLSYYEPATWSWDFGDPASGGGSNERHPGHQYDKAGIYQVCLTVSNTNGTDTHCKTLYLGVSAQDNPVLQAQVSVWPNPFHERLSVSLSASLPNPVFRLYDITGRLVQEQRMVMGVNDIPAVGLVAGMYFWEMTAGSERVRVGKVVKYE